MRREIILTNVNNARRASIFEEKIILDLVILHKETGNFVMQNEMLKYFLLL
jgi:hypothetical protein